MVCLFTSLLLLLSSSSSGKLRYANNSNYKNDTMIRKEVRMLESLVGIIWNYFYCRYMLIRL